MRWDDNSMGSTFDYDWGSINQAFSSGQVGMFTGGSDLYTAMVQNNSIKPDDYGVTTIPLADDADAGVLGGGTLAAVNVVTNEDQRDAAVDWIDFYYMQKLLTQDGAVADAEALKANNQPVGVPALPIFDKATYDQSQEWIKDYINVPMAQMTAVHVADLRPADRDRADRPHPGALRGPRPRRAGRPHRQERRHRRAARCGQQPGPGDHRRGLSPYVDRPGPGTAGARSPSSVTGDGAGIVREAPTAP